MMTINSQDTLYYEHRKQCHELGQKTRQARNQQDESRAKFFTNHFYKIKGMYKDQKQRDHLQMSFNLGYQDG